MAEDEAIGRNAGRGRATETGTGSLVGGAGGLPRTIASATTMRPAASAPTESRPRLGPRRACRR
jgi:hypothetical protein